MAIEERRQTCSLCNGTGDLPVRVHEELDDMRRRMVLLEMNNANMAMALIEIHEYKSKRPLEDQIAKVRKIAATASPYWGSVT